MVSPLMGGNALSTISAAFNPQASNTLKDMVKPGTAAGDTQLGKAIASGAEKFSQIGDAIKSTLGSNPAVSTPQGSPPPVRGTLAPSYAGAAPMTPPPSATGSIGPWTGFTNAGRRSLLGG